MISYIEASTPKTQAELRALALANLAAAGSPVAGWSANAPQRKAVDDFAARMAEETEIRALLAATISPQTAAAAGRDWTLAVIAWFDETYIPALPAIWDVTITVLASQAPLTIGLGTVLQLQSASGQILELIPSSNATLSATSSPTAYQATLRFVARSAGTAGNSLGASLKVIAGPAGLSASSPLLFTAGRDEEDPAASIRRCLGKWSRLGAGWTLAAFDYLIPLASPTVTRWIVDSANPRGPGTTLVLAANASGPATTQELGGIYAKLSARDVRALGSGEVFVEAPVTDTLVFSVTVLGDGTNVNLANDIENALTTLVNSYSIGPAVLSLDVIRAVILGAAFTAIDVNDGSGVLITLPVNLPGFFGCASITTCSLLADLVIASGHVLVITPTATVT